ncbi:MAG: hypothetical protein EOO38_00020 [Cytophagaceae bacterium]|nr:MAG: hypothetical protein EOO38_00020 [Cytophagaceae bacterium]
MASPTLQQVHVNVPLTNVSIAYQQEQKDFICDTMFPVVASQKQSNLYFSYDRSYWMRTGAQRRAPATESAGGGFQISANNSYFCHKYAFHMDIADELQTEADSPINIQSSATEFVTRNLLLRREKDFFARYWAPNVWGGFGLTNSSGVYTTADYAPQTPWSDDRSNPMAEIAGVKTGVKRTTGFEPNIMAVTYDLNERLKQHPLVLDRIKYTETAIATEDLLARLFNVDKYVVASAVENTTQEGQTPNYDFMMKGKFLLCYAPKSAGLMQPSAGYTFTWNGLLGAGVNGSRTKTIRMEALEALRVEGEMAYDQKIVSRDLGVLGTNVL